MKLKENNSPIVVESLKLPNRILKKHGTRYKISLKWQKRYVWYSGGADISMMPGPGPSL